LADGYSLSQVAHNGDGVRLAISGELDIANAEAFTGEVYSLCEPVDGPVTIDFRKCVFIDSTGIRALMALAQEQQVQGRTLKLSGLTGEPARVLRLSGVLDSGLFASDG
jgi:anti-sigma B factor antagonist